MADVDDLKTIKSQLIARLKSVTAEDKPTYTVRGQTVKWAEYLKILTNQIREIDELISNDEGPYEEETLVFL